MSSPICPPFPPAQIKALIFTGIGWRRFHLSSWAEIREMRGSKIEVKYAIEVKYFIFELGYLWNIQNKFKEYKLQIQKYRIHWKYLNPSSIPQDAPDINPSSTPHPKIPPTCTVFTVVTGTGTSFFTGTSTGTCTSCTTHLGTFFTWKKGDRLL